MEYRTLGTTGLKVSPLAFGTWRFGVETDGTVETDRGTAHELLDTFAAEGGNFIDTANNYSSGTSEQWIGEWLESRDREDFVIASKVYWNNVSRFTHNLSRKNIREEIEGTLERLGTDYIDIYYIHRWDEDTPIEETLKTLDDLISEGKVNYIGASSMAAWHLTKGLWKSETLGTDRFTITQPRFNAADREYVSKYLDVCADQDLAVCPYSPLEGGFLAGKYRRTEDGIESPTESRADLEGWEDRQWNVLDAIQTVAADLDATATQVALRWLIEQERFTCVPVIGARTTDQMRENMGAVDISLSSEQFDQITQAYE